MDNPLSAYLVRKDSTVAAFAKRIGRSRSHLGRLISGETEADATTLSLIEKHTHGAVTPSEWVRWWASTRTGVRC